MDFLLLRLAYPALSFGALCAPATTYNTALFGLSDGSRRLVTAGPIIRRICLKPGTC